MTELSDDQQKIIGRMRKTERAWRWQRHVELWGGVVTLVFSLWLLVSVLLAARTCQADSGMRIVGLPVVVPMCLMCVVGSFYCIQKAVVYWHGNPVHTFLLSMVDGMEDKAG